MNRTVAIPGVCVLLLLSQAGLAEPEETKTRLSETDEYFFMTPGGLIGHPSERIMDVFFSFHRDAKALERAREWKEEGMRVGAWGLRLMPEDAKRYKEEQDPDKKKKIRVEGVGKMLKAFGPDFVLVDEPNFPGPFRQFFVGGYGPYDDKHKEGFIGYLQGKFSSAELKRKFGVAKLAEELVFSDDMAEEQPGLFYEFKIYHYWDLARRLKEIRELVKGQEPGMDYYINFSLAALEPGARYCGVDYSYYSQASWIDFVSTDPYAHIRQNCQYWDSFGANLVETFANKPTGIWVSSSHTYVTRPRDNFLGLMAGFCQGVDFLAVHRYTHATRYLAAVMEKGLEGVDGRTRGYYYHYSEKWKWICRAIDFAKANHWLKPYRSRHKVALYFSMNTFLTKYFKCAWSKQSGAWGTEYFVERAYYSAIRAHLPCDVVMPMLLGEKKDEILRDKLQQYEVIVALDPENMSDFEVTMFRDWVADGGFLVATGKPGLSDEIGTPREGFVLKDVFGCEIGEEATRIYMELADDRGVFKSFETGNRVFCEGLPKTRFLSIPFSKAVYVGSHAGYYPRGPVHPVIGKRKVNWKERYRALEDSIKQLIVRVPSYRPTTAKTLWNWDDGTPAVVANAFGKGKAILSGSTDVFVGFEVDGWEEEDYLAFLGDLVHSGWDELQVNCRNEVEVNLLTNQAEDALVVTYLNYDAFPEPSTVLKLSVGRKKPKQVRFITVGAKEPSQEKSVKFEVADGWLEAKVPPVPLCALVKIGFERGEAPQNRSSGR